jgi:hypothetical protein
MPYSFNAIVHLIVPVPDSTGTELSEDAIDETLQTAKETLVRTMDHITGFSIIDVTPLGRPEGDNALSVEVSLSYAINTETATASRDAGDTILQDDLDALLAVEAIEHASSDQTSVAEPAVPPAHALLYP